MIITVENTESGVCLIPEGRIDTSTADEFEEALKRVIPGARCVRVDCKKLEYISSAGLRVLLNGQKKLKAAGKELVILNINEMVGEVLQSTGFNQVLEIK